MSCPYHWELEPRKAVIPAKACFRYLIRDGKVSNFSVYP